MVEKTFNELSKEKKERKKDHDAQVKKHNDSLNLVVIIKMMEQRQADLQVIETAAKKENRAEAEKKDDIQGVKDTYANVLREAYGLEDEAEIDEIADHLAKLKTDDEKKAYLQEKIGARLQAFEQQNYETATDPFTGAVTRRLKPLAADDARELSPEARLKLGERRGLVNSVLGEASNMAGVNIQLMQGMWGVESTFGKKVLSPTGCTGDWQFTKATFDATCAKYNIIQKLRDAGQKLNDPKLLEAADKLQNYFNDGKPRYPKEQIELDPRNDPLISTMAAAFYVKEVAAIAKVDPKDTKNFGAIYAGYNVGPANAALLVGKLFTTANAGSYFPKESGPNAIFFKNGETGQQALANYQMFVERRLDQYNKTFGIAADPSLNTDNTAAFNNVVINAPIGGQLTAQISTTQNNSFMAKSFYGATSGLTQPSLSFGMAPQTPGSPFMASFNSLGFGNTGSGFSNFNAGQIHTPFNFTFDPNKLG